MSRRLDPEAIACPDCDLLQAVPPLPPSAKALCRRCGATLATQKPYPPGHPLALAIAAAVVLTLANAAPLMRVTSNGRETSTTLLGGAHRMWLHGQEITAVAVAFCAVVAPALYIAFVIAVLVAIRRPPAPAWIATCLRGADSMRPWSMDDVMLLGILVALTKIAELATVIPGMGMTALAVLVLLLAAVMESFDPRDAWERIGWVERRSQAGSRDTVVQPRQ